MIPPATAPLAIVLENRAAQSILLEALNGYSRYAVEKLGHPINSSVLNPIKEVLVNHLNGK